MAIKAIVFDLFNTLVTDIDNHDRDRSAFPQIPEQDLRDFRNVQSFGAPRKLIDAVEEHFKLSLSQKRKQEILSVFSKWCEKQTPYPETREVLAELKKTHKIALISNASDFIEPVFEQCGLGKYFDVIIFSHKVGMKKPDPRIFTLCASKLGLRPDECLMVGDSLHADVEGPKAIGMKSILIDRENRHPDFPRITDLRDLLKKDAF